MEAFTSGLVTAEQRKGYLATHAWMHDAFSYVGHGQYRMIAWESQIDFCRAVAPADYPTPRKEGKQPWRD